MKFNTSEELSRFYEDEEHSGFRKEIYESLDPRIQHMYELAEKDSIIDSESEEKKLIYEFIESMAHTYMNRKDYVDDESILEMVTTTEPYHF